MNGMILKSIAWALTLGLSLWGPGVSTAGAQVAELERIRDWDPALCAGVEALAQDPEIKNNAELREICIELAVGCLDDPRAQTELVREVQVMSRQGVDPRTVIAPEVRAKTQEIYTQWKEETSARLTELRRTDPEKARQLDFQLREGERQMTAFQGGERYVPSPEMREEAKKTFEQWEKTALADGRMSEETLRAMKMEFMHWTEGSMGMGPMMGRGHDPAMEARMRGAVYDKGAAAEFAKQLGLDPKLNLNDPGVLKQLKDAGKITDADLNRMMAQGDIRLMEGVRTLRGDNPYPTMHGGSDYRGPMPAMPQNVHYNEKGQLMVMDPKTGISKQWDRATMGEPPVPMGQPSYERGGTWPSGDMRMPPGDPRTWTDAQRAQYEAMRTSPHGGGGWERTTWNPPGDPATWTPEQRAQYEAMRTSPHGGGGWERSTWTPPGDPATWTPEQRASYDAQRSHWEGSGAGTHYGGSWERGAGTWTQADMEAMRTSGGSGWNPSGSSGWESSYSGGGWSSGGTDWSAGGGTTSGYTDWSAGGGTTYYGGGDWSTSTSGGSTYTGGTTYYSSTENHNYSTAQETLKYPDGHTVCPAGKAHQEGVAEGTGHCL